MEIDINLDWYIEMLNNNFQYSFFQDYDFLYSKVGYQRRPKLKIYITIAHTYMSSSKMSNIFKALGCGNV